MDFKTVPFDLRELKAASDTAGWEFTGYASTYGNVDQGGDVVLAGAFDASLKARPRPKLLWQHDLREPIGVPLDLKSDDHGLLGSWRIVDTAKGSDAYKLLKAGAVDSLSIGYIPTESDFDKDGEVRLLKAVDLLEVSVVSVPMNDKALVTAVKADATFAGQWDAAVDNLVTTVARAEALQRRRGVEERELSKSETLILRKAVGQVLPLLGRMQALIATREKARADADELHVRVELARRRLEQAGLLERESPSAAVRVPGFSPAPPTAAGTPAPDSDSDSDSDSEDGSGLGGGVPPDGAAPTPTPQRATEAHAR